MIVYINQITSECEYTECSLCRVYLNIFKISNFCISHAKIVNAPRGAVESPKDKFEVFYIDYGNQEVVPYSELRPLDPSVSSAPGLAQLCSLAYVKVPSLEEDFGQEAAEYLSEHTLNSEFRAMVEEKDLSGGKVKGQGTGPVLVVTLVAVDAEISVNAAMLQV